uniref:Uncharacterized protein n=1 Tax=Falco tinnunculus TaxID=100819 RepID=A0A8C4UFP1_FALTI
VAEPADCSPALGSQALEMRWKDPAAVAMGKGDKKCMGYKKEPQAGHIHRVLEQVCAPWAFLPRKYTRICEQSLCKPCPRGVGFWHSVYLTAAVPQGMKATTKYTSS